MSTFLDRPERHIGRASRPAAPQRLPLLALAIAQGAGTMVYSALPPVLPHYVRFLHLGLNGAGLLTAAFGMGGLVGVLPAAVSSGRNPRWTSFAGLAILAGATTEMAWAHASAEVILGRAGQGLGDALAFAGAVTAAFQQAPTSGRSEFLGKMTAVAVVGAFLGPAIGASAGEWGTRWAFTAAAACLALLAPTTLRIPVSSGTQQPAGRMVLGTFQTIRRPQSVPLGMQALLSGLLATLGPLRLAGVRFSPAAIAVAFLSGAVAATACYARVGRRSDRLGEARVTVELLALCALGAAAMARVQERWMLVVLLSLDAALFNVLAIPAISRLYSRDQRSGHHHGSASATALAVWAAFNVAGALGSASIAASLGTSTPFLVAAGLCLLSLVLERPARSPDGPHRSRSLRGPRR